jgi:hypothetical protein
MSKDVWQIYAVRYAHHERMARENFMGGDPHDDSPMPLDYYVWGLISEIGSSSWTPDSTGRWHRSESGPC